MLSSKPAATGPPCRLKEGASAERRRSALAMSCMMTLRRLGTQLVRIEVLMPGRTLDNSSLIRV